MLCSIDCGLSCPGNTQVDLPFDFSILVLSCLPSQIKCPDVWRLELLSDSYATGSVMIGTIWPCDSQLWWVPVAAVPSFLLLDAALLSIWEISRSRTTEHKMEEEAIERSSFVSQRQWHCQIAGFINLFMQLSHLYWGFVTDFSWWGVGGGGGGGGDSEGHMIL